MSYFLKNLKKSGHLDDIYLTVAIIGSRQLDGESYDQHSKEWQDFIPNLMILGFDADINACNRINSELEKNNVDWTEIHVPLTLWSKVEERQIYIARYSACTSLYYPSSDFKDRFTNTAENLEIVRTDMVQTTTLDDFCESEGITEIDVIKVDVQGAELAIFQGASKILPTTLAIVTEIEFIEVYEKQPLFSDIDIHLRNQGFTLFDFTEIRRNERKNIPIISERHPGMMSYTDAFYFRDLISEKLRKSSNNANQILKLACVADAMDFPDYALETLVYLTRNFAKIKPQYNFAPVIVESLSEIPELLALPAVQEKGLNTLPIVAEMQQYL